MKVIQSLLLAFFVAFQDVQGIGEDYIEQVPKTVYESETMSPQNMDFDAVNNRFIAHAGWYNNKLIHYYKFRMFTPSTYPDVVGPGSPSTAIPTQKIYFVTTDGTMDGVVGRPIIQYHTVDGVVYSDFMEVNLVTAPADYVADTFKSEGDVFSGGGATVSPTGIMLNIPVVPVGATLQDPHASTGETATNGATELAPIDPVRVWYKGVEAWTYVFEVTDQIAADYFASTRNDPSKPGFGITVTNFATADSVNAIPIWHVNQFTRGVTDSNFGGPSDMGMRNVINLDRGDDGYSPLWQVFWLTAMPIDYIADQASNGATMNSQNGFETFVSPMFVNCPDIGKVGEMNSAMASEFKTEIDTSQATNWVLGSHPSLIMKPDIDVIIKTADGTVVATGATNMMGAFEIEVMSSDIPDGAEELMVQTGGQDIRTIPVIMTSEPDETSAASSFDFSGFLAFSAVALAALLI